MAQFREKALTLISGYKKIVKRQLPQSAASKRFRNLNIKTRQLTLASDVELYHATSAIREYITRDIEKNLPTTYEYSGTVKFNQELSTLLDAYMMKDGNVTNKMFEGSRALLNAIQLITAPINDKNRQKLEENLSCLECYGTREQLAKIIHALQKQTSDTEQPYQPYIESLMRTYKSNEL